MASVSPTALLDPGGQDVHCVLPILDLYEEVPQAVHPTLATVASPPYPAEHSQRPASVFSIVPAITRVRANGTLYVRL